VELTLAMPARRIDAHPRVDAVRGCAALARGPVVYCLEHADLPGVCFEDVELDPTVPVEAAAHPITPVALMVPVRLRPDDPAELYRPHRPAAPEPVVTATVPAIPYFLWANRSPGPMRVWIPVAAQEA
jgi:hypothetical protein